MASHWAEGGKGAVELASAVVELCEAAVAITEARSLGDDESRGRSGIRGSVALTPQGWRLTRATRRIRRAAPSLPRRKAE
jgi:hypothetical protein